jgi:putative oxidoreductase
MRILARWQPQCLSVLRIVTALVFMQHGTQKVFHFPPNPDGGGNGPAVLSLIWFAGVIELVGGALLTVGLFIVSGELAFAYFIAHAPQNFYPALNRGDEAVILCFVFLYIATAGGGPWSLDALMGRGKTVAGAAA